MPRSSDRSLEAVRKRLAGGLCCKLQAGSCWVVAASRLGQPPRTGRSAGVAWTTAAFRNNGPILHRAFLAAGREATEFISRDKRAAAALYLDAMTSTVPLDDAAAVVSEPEVTCRSARR